MNRSKDKNKSGKQKQSWLWESFGAGSGVMGMSLIVSLAVVGAVWLSRVVLGYLVSDNCDVSNFWGSFGVHVWIEAVVGALSAGFVVFQLRNGEKATKHQSDVEKAEFILEYNRSFIENEKMTDIERYLECRMTGAAFDEVYNLTAYRQETVNYLVYLEGLATCILSEVLDYENVDDLFAYRFFLAVNHPEIQSMDLLPYARYYRGCFKLYRQWRKHRQTCGKYTEDDHWDIPHWETELCHQYGYERILFPKLVVERHLNRKEPADGKDPEIIVKYPIKTRKSNNDGELTTILTLKYVNTQIPNPKYPQAGKVKHSEITSITFSDASAKKIGNDPEKDPTREDFLRAAIKELLERENPYKITVVKEACDEKQISDMCATLFQARTILYKEGVFCHQLTDATKFDPKSGNLERIAQLIYDTDPYIYPDMLGGNKEIAVKVLAEILRQGKDPMFRLGNIYACMVRDQIVGIVLWYKGELNWSTTAVTDAFAQVSKIESEKQEKAVEFSAPGTLGAVATQYVSKYSTHTISNTIDLLNVCIAQDMQGKGIGEKMLQRFLEEHREETCKLCVLSNNEGAIHLYKKCGFTYVNQEDAYAPGKNLKRDNMVRPRLLKTYARRTR